MSNKPNSTQAYANYVRNMGNNLIRFADDLEMLAAGGRVCRAFPADLPAPEAEQPVEYTEAQARQSIEDTVVDLANVCLPDN